MSVPNTTQNGARADPPVPLSPIATAPRQHPVNSTIDISSPLTPSRSLPHTASSKDPSAPERDTIWRSSLRWAASRLPPRLVDVISHNVGLAFVAVAQLFFVFMGLSVKYFLSVTGMSAATLIFVRMGITAIGCIISLRVIKDPNPLWGPPEIRKILVLRGTFGWLGLLSSYQSLRGMTLSDAITIQFLSPSVTALLGFIFLKEMLSRREILAGLFCLVGVIFVSRPPILFGAPVENNPTDDGGGTRLDLPVPPGEGVQIDAPDRAISVAWAFVNILFVSLAYTTIRWIGNKAHALHSIAYFSYICTITCGFWMLVDPNPLVFPSTPSALFFIVLIGVFGFCAQIFLTLGLQREKAGRAGLAMYLQVVFSILFEFLLWGTIPSLLSSIGTGLIICSASWAAMAKVQTKPKVDDPEALPFSRSPSPIPPPSASFPSRPGPRSDEHRSYDSIPTSDSPPDDSGDFDRNAASNLSRKNSSGLEVPWMTTRSRMGSASSNISTISKPRS